MVSRFTKEDVKVSVSEGRKHFHNQRKTSLYGSETPRDGKNRSYDQRYSNLRNIIAPSDGRIIYEDDISRKNGDDHIDSQNMASNPPPVRTRLQYEYEKALQDKAKEDSERQGDKSFPGFGGNFGSGISSANKDAYNKRKSESYIQNDKSGNSFNSLGLRNDSEENKGQDNSATHYKTYDEAKSYADYLEKEIQRLKMKQKDDLGKLTDYPPKKDQYQSNLNESTNQHNYGYNDYISQEQSNTHGDYDGNNTMSYYNQTNKNGDVYNGKNNSEMLRNNYDREDTRTDLQQEAEYRARMRELDRLRDEQDEHNDSKEYNNNGYQEHNLIKEDDSRNKKQQRINSSTSSSTKNDYRQYTNEEYQYCRRSPINPSLNQKTSLVGSVQRGSNASRETIKSPLKKQFNNNTTNNIFPSAIDEDQLPNGQKYKVKAPFATD